MTVAMGSQTCSCCKATTCFVVMVVVGIVLICLGAGSMPLFTRIYEKMVKQVNMKRCV